MGKKRKAAQAPQRSTRLKSYTCPLCKRAGTVTVRMKREKDQSIGQMSAQCHCSSCGKGYNINRLSYLENEKNAYMQWVAHETDKRTFGVKCPDCRKLCVLYIDIRNGERFGIVQCENCRYEYHFVPLIGETRSELTQRINEKKLKPMS